MNGLIAGVPAKRRFQQRDSGPLQPGDVRRQRPSGSTVVQIHQSDSGPLQPADMDRQHGQRKCKMTRCSGGPTVASSASGHVPPWRLREFFRYALRSVVWFGLVGLLCQCLTQHYLFSRIRFGMIP